MSDDTEINKIRLAIETGLHPGPPECFMFEPTSVMAVFVRGQGIKLVFIRKADRKGYPWANQMAFPGGHWEKGDGSLENTALRELEEEMGIKPENMGLFGSLGHFQTRHGKSIEAFAGEWNEKDKICYDTNEISEVFFIPFSYLVKVHKDKRFHEYSPDVEELVYPYEGVKIWGVTAKMVRHLINLLLEQEENLR